MTKQDSILNTAVQNCVNQAVENKKKAAPCSRCKDLKEELDTQIEMYNETVAMLEREVERKSSSDWIGCEGQPNINLADIMSFEALSYPVNRPKDERRLVILFTKNREADEIWTFPDTATRNAVLLKIRKDRVHMIVIDKEPSK